MLFSVIVIIIIAIVAYFHYAQGLFSAMLSAICAIFAAILAMSFYEPLVNALMRGKIPDVAHSLALVILFALIYVILRVIFDKSVPGNVRVPLLVDKVGAGVMGVVAAIFAAGIFAVAVQMLPFGPSIGGFSRWTTASRATTAAIPGQRSVDVQVVDEVRQPDLNPQQASGPLIPAGQAVVSLVEHLSDNGSLSNDRPFGAVHTDFLNELFAQRLGIQLGAKHTATNYPQEAPVVSVKGVYHASSLPQVDMELPTIRGSGDSPVKPGEEILKSDVLIIRTAFSSDAADTDGRVRVSCGAVRLSVGGQNYHPIGVFSKGVIYRNRPDDFLVVPVAGSDATVDFVFLMTPELVDSSGNPNEPGKIAAGAVYEAKQGGIVAIGGTPIEKDLPTTEASGPLLKNVKLPKVASAAAAAAASTPGAEAAAAAKAPLGIKGITISDKLFQGINVGFSGGGSQETTFASGTSSIRDGKFTRLTVNTNQSLQLLGQNTTLDTFFVPQGMKMVQIQADPPTASDADPWAWAQNLSAFEIVDTKGTHYKPNGAWAKISQGAAQKMVARYDASSPVASIEKEDGRPLDVWIAYLISDGTKLKTLNYQGKPIRSLDLTVK